MGKINIQRVRGYTIAETVIALAILGIVITGIGQFASYINTGIEDLRLSKQIRWEIENARELIGTWPVERVTTQNIDQLPISAQLADELSEAKWKSAVTPASFSLSPSPSVANIADATPIAVPAKAVTLQLHAQYKGQSISPVELTFWVFDSTNKANTIQADSVKPDTIKADSNNANTNEANSSPDDSKEAP